MNKNIGIDIVTPVHNEGTSIKDTLFEFFETYNGTQFVVKFIVSEDGSTDNSVEEIIKVSKEYNLELISESVRKGYSKAVIDGLLKVKSPIVSFIDSDGQCNPKDLKNLYDKFDGNNLVIGYRNPRRDSFIRKIMSHAFKLVFERFFKLRLIDPSCPFFLTSLDNLNKILATPNMGILKQGFWWEFYARAYHLGINIVQCPIDHRKRSSGKTVVYRPSKIPKIALEHLKGLKALKNTLENI